MEILKFFNGQRHNSNVKNENDPLNPLKINLLNLKFYWSFLHHNLKIE